MGRRPQGSRTGPTQRHAPVAPAVGTADARVLSPDSVDDLIQLLRDEGYQVIGPTVRDGSIVLDEIMSSEDLPIGLTCVQGPGTSRLRPRDDLAWFGHAVGPQSVKRYLFPPRETVVTLDSRGRVLRSHHDESTQPRYAFLGVRGCDVAAIAILDRVLRRPGIEDPTYALRRDRSLVIAVECGTSAATCFCDSVGCGPDVTQGADLVLTELLDPVHEFLARAGSPRGHGVLAELEGRPATPPDLDRRQDALACARGQQVRRMPPDMPEVLRRSATHPNWEDIAARCLSCGNCTLVCPTCFCSDTADVTDLSSETFQRERRWDSCFAVDFTQMAGGSPTRSHTASRYRQWMTHKLSSWVDQFGTSGCVGCGRCITWCPPGIDITQEATIMSAAPGNHDGEVGP